MKSPAGRLVTKTGEENTSNQQETDDFHNKTTCSESHHQRETNGAMRTGRESLEWFLAMEKAEQDKKYSPETLPAPDLVSC